MIVSRLISRLVSLPRRVLRAEQESGLARWKDSFAAMQSLLTIVGLLLALTWFVGQHQTKEQLKIEVVLSQHRFSQQSHEVLLGVEVFVTNTGKVAVYFDVERLWIHEISPGDGNLLYRRVITRSRREESDELTAETPVRQDTPVERYYSSWARSFGWLWTHPTFKWFEPGERDQSWSSIYRIDDDIKTLMITMEVVSVNGGKWRYSTTYDIGSSTCNSSTK